MTKREKADRQYYRLCKKLGGGQCLNLTTKQKNDLLMGVYDCFPVVKLKDGSVAAYHKELGGWIRLT